MLKLFGTDGIRGVAFEFLTYELAKKVGRALGHVLSENNQNVGKVLIGKDTRISGQTLTEAISEGLSDMGFDSYILGTISTPAVAYLTRTQGFDAGIMISASHNPYEYNGIKIFGKNGFKLTDEEEEKIEELIFDGAQSDQIASYSAKTFNADNLKKDYIEYLKRSAGCSLSGMRIVIDCANGSAYATAKDVFPSLGAECEFLACEPDGKNINASCGSTHLEALTEHVKQGGFDAGFAFDGDADRCLAIDENGCVIDGDYILAILSLMLRKHGKLASDTVVGTVMANCGFSKFCEKNGIRFIDTKVGDRYVLEEMEKNSYSLGGEQSGHIIIRDYATTGDGQLTALFLLSAIKESGKKLSELAAVMHKYPQHMINIKASDSQKKALKFDETIKSVISSANEKLAGNGRLLIRPSGTEPLVRIMVESEDHTNTVNLCENIASDIKKALDKY